MKRTFDLTDTHVIERAGCVLEVDVKALPEVILAQLVLHGLTQKIGDSAASAVSTTYEAANEGKQWAKLAPKDKRAWKEANSDAVQKTAEGDMRGTMAQLYDGVWGAVRTGAGLTPLDKMMVSIIRPVVKKANEAAYKSAKEADRVFACVRHIEMLDPSKQEALRQMAEARIEQERRDREAVAELDLDL
jgi:hypothetical protein